MGEARRRRGEVVTAICYNANTKEYSLLTFHGIQSMLEVTNKCVAEFPLEEQKHMHIVVVLNGVVTAHKDWCDYAIKMDP